MYLDCSTLKQRTSVKMVASRMDFKVCLFLFVEFWKISKVKARIGGLVNASVVVRVHLGLGWGAGCTSIKAFFKQPIWSLKTWETKPQLTREWDTWLLTCFVHYYARRCVDLHPGPASDCRDNWKMGLMSLLTIDLVFLNFLECIDSVLFNRASCSCTVTTMLTLKNSVIINFMNKICMQPFKRWM